VAESVAFALADTLAERRAIKKRVVELYGLRSRISHGHTVQVPWTELLELTQITQDFLYQMVWTHGEFKTKTDLMEWIETKRLT
jgi:hypothetical protein